MTRQEAYSYADGSPMALGDLCVIGRFPGVWEVYHLGTFTNGRQYASIVSTQGRVRRTAAGLHELRLCARRTEHEVGRAVQRAQVTGDLL